MSSESRGCRPRPQRAGNLAGDDARHAEGLPQAGDQGLDNTPTWGRKYWGGAIFCLLADIEIRKRCVASACRTRCAACSPPAAIMSRTGRSRILATADKAVGVDVLTRLHNEMGPKPVTPDLAALWRDLGLKRVGEDIEFDDSAARGDPQGDHRAARNRAIDPAADRRRTIRKRSIRTGSWRRRARDASRCGIPRVRSLRSA